MADKKKPLCMEEFIHRVYEVSIEAMLPGDYRKSDPGDLCHDLCDEIEVLYNEYLRYKELANRLGVINV